MKKNIVITYEIYFPEELELDADIFIHEFISKTKLTQKELDSNQILNKLGINIKINNVEVLDVPAIQEFTSGGFEEE